MSKLIGFRVNKHGFETPKKVTTRELVSELAPSDELKASTKKMSDYLLALPIKTPEYLKLLSMLQDYDLDAKAWGFEQGFEWAIDTCQKHSEEE